MTPDYLYSKLKRLNTIPNGVLPERIAETFEPFVKIWHTHFFDEWTTEHFETWLCDNIQALPKSHKRHVLMNFQNFGLPSSILAFKIILLSTQIKDLIHLGYERAILSLSQSQQDILLNYYETKTRFDKSLPLELAIIAVFNNIPLDSNSIYECSQLENSNFLLIELILKLNIPVDTHSFEAILNLMSEIRTLINIRDLEINPETILTYEVVFAILFDNLNMVRNSVNLNIVADSDNLKNVAEYCFDNSMSKENFIDSITTETVSKHFVSVFFTHSNK